MYNQIRALRRSSPIIVRCFALIDLSDEWLLSIVAVDTGSISKRRKITEMLG
jgi:hypothetical protein